MFRNLSLTRFSLSLTTKICFFFYLDSVWNVVMLLYAFFRVDYDYYNNNIHFQFILSRRRRLKKSFHVVSSSRDA